MCFLCVGFVLVFSVCILSVDILFGCIFNVFVGF